MKRGVAWSGIEDQIREIATVVFTAARRPMVDSFATATQATRDARGAGKLFSHWRLDFLLDEDARVWLLEVEIVPSTGTIGGVDEVIKTTVLRDVLALSGVGGDPVDDAQYPWLRGAECWTDAASPGVPPNRVCAPADAASRRFGEDGFHAAKRDVLDDLGRRGDPLAFDVDAVDAVAAYEASARRAGGYRPLIPVPRSFEYFDGSVGAQGDDVAALFRDHGALGLDLVLDKWAARPREAEADGAAAWVDFASPRAAADACRACPPGHAFCATVTGLDAASGEPSFGGRCQAPRAPCLDATRGLVDGVPLSRDDCGLDVDLRTIARVLRLSQIGTLAPHEDALSHWCSRALRVAPGGAVVRDLAALCRGRPRQVQIPEADPSKLADARVSTASLRPPGAPR